MGFLTRTHKADSSRGRLCLPAGCFTVDRDGGVVSSTLPQSFPPALVSQIGRTVLRTFHSAQEAQLVFQEIRIHFAEVRITARELRGGAIIYLTPGNNLPLPPSCI